MPTARSKEGTSAENRNPRETCGKCDEEVSNSDLFVMCSTCSLHYHIQCQKISKGKLKVIQEEDGILWFCHACRRTTRNMIGKMSEMEKRLVSLESQMKTSIQEIKNLRNQCESLQTKNSALEKAVTETKENLKNAENQRGFQSGIIDNLRRDLYKEHNRNISIEQQLDCIKQASRENNVRIVDMPESDEKDLKKQILDLLSIPDITEEDIQSTYRLGKPKDSKARDVIVKFASKQKRDIFYSMRKSTPKGRDNKKVFINEDLTQFRSKLFFDARRLVKTRKLHSTWTQEGNVIIKLNEEESPVAIATHQELRSKVFGYQFEDIEICSTSSEIDDCMSSDLNSL